MRSNKVHTSRKSIVDDSEYRFSHMKKPRGYGAWAFNIDGETFWVTGFYACAKHAAIEKAKTIAPKGTIINVLP